MAASSNSCDVVIDIDALHDSTSKAGISSIYSPRSMMVSSADGPDSLAASVVREAIEVETVDQAAPEPSSSPSSSSPRLPRTSAKRIALATPNLCPDEPVLASTYEAATTTSTNDEKAPLLASPPPLTSASSRRDTVLYLAYGSNMAAATFEGTRKIKPLSAVTVSAPTLRLTFDLPGFPYREPCFANTTFRKPPKTPPVPIPPPPGAPGPINPPGNVSNSANTTDPKTPVFDGPLYGVVYEVTRDDYARIIATEGGGSSYQDILVPCFVVAPRMGVPEKPALPVPVRPFLAHTLYAPMRNPMRSPSTEDSDKDKSGGDDNGDNNGDDNDGDDDDDGCLTRLWKALAKWAAPRGRPDPDYAQPSQRYLSLLIAGADEHELPQAYQDWLASLQPYTITSWRQKVGGALILLVSLPFLLMVLAMQWLPTKKGSTGRVSPGVAVLLNAVFRAMWWLYDHVFRPLFGDGERTQDGEGEGKGDIISKVARKGEIRLK
ncbi:MAG: hypothetical protein STHCBS139747_006876 [Sporothrix thermara]